MTQPRSVGDGLAVGLVEHCPDLAALGRVGTAGSVSFHHDYLPVVGFDDGPEVRPEPPPTIIRLAARHSARRYRRQAPVRA